MNYCWHTQDDSNRLNVEQKPDTSSFIMYDSIYIKFKKMQIRMMDPTSTDGRANGCY